MNLPNLEHGVLSNVFSFLDKSDVLQYLFTCKRAFRANEELAKEMYCECYGDVFSFAQLLRISGIFVSGYDSEPQYTEMWKRRPLLDALNVEQMCQQSEQILLQVENGTEDKLRLVESAATTLLNAFEVDNTCLPVYKLLAVCCILTCAYDNALAIVQVGKQFGAEYFVELEAEIESQTANSFELTQGNALSPQLESALTQIFYRYDLNGDSCLNFQELSVCVERTGSQLTMQNYAELTVAFESTPNGLTLRGFLMFYLEQTLSSPEETLKDLEAHTV